eukprot:CAMPEP_0198136934 /NCGR_PEP_ID=MMETSP1443-20131203/493_1 /TAXON_ID=186043 /ORGANISM="Entomoneis sp., Strain CCMP2396" /LENGTH=36 /DNA_ID= /DNA_START= /DNA_END= /DNA_ORIENTATION=
MADDAVARTLGAAFDKNNVDMIESDTLVSGCSFFTV